MGDGATRSGRTVETMTTPNQSRIEAALGAVGAAPKRTGTAGKFEIFCPLPSHNDGKGARKSRSAWVHYKPDGGVVIGCSVCGTADKGTQLEWASALGVDVRDFYTPGGGGGGAGAGSKRRAAAPMADGLDEAEVRPFDAPGADAGYAWPEAMPKSPGFTLVGAWHYQNAAGRYVASVGRYDSPGKGKTYRKRHWDGLRWVAKSHPHTAPLYRLPEVLQVGTGEGAAGWLVLCEGEKAADALRAALRAAEVKGWAVSTLEGGARSPWVGHHAHAVRGRRVVVVPDNDDPGRESAHARATSAHVSGAACVRILQLDGVAGVNLPVKGDAVEWLTGGGSAAAFVAAVEAGDDWSPEPQGRPVVELAADEELSSRAVWSALESLPAAQRPPLYVWQHGLALVEPDADSEAGFQRVTALSPVRWRQILGAHTRPVQWSEKKEALVDVRYGRDFASYTMQVGCGGAVPEWVPRLRTVYRTPTWVLGDAGAPRLLCDGYDRLSGALVDGGWLRFDLDYTAVTKADVEQAVGLLLDVCHDFPYRDGSSFANHIAMGLSAAARPLIEGPVPLFAVVGPQEGVGKTLVVRTMAMGLTGTKPAKLEAPRKGNDEEWAKQITAVLADARPMTLIDNLPRGSVLHSNALSSLLTETEWEFRPPHQPTTWKLRNHTVWAATGINSHFSGETGRRVVLVELEPAEEDATTRTGFRHPLTDDGYLSRTLRPRLLRALHVLIAWWVKSGMPGPGEHVPRKGSYESWRHVVGGVLECAGVRGFLGNAGELKSRVETSGNDMREFVERWAACTLKRLDRTTEPRTTKDILSLAESEGAFPHLRDAKSPTGALGIMLKEDEGRNFGGWRIRRGSRTKSGTTWFLEPVGTIVPGEWAQDVVDDGCRGQQTLHQTLHPSNDAESIGKFGAVKGVKGKLGKSLVRAHAHTHARDEGLYGFDPSPPSPVFVSDCDDSEILGVGSEGYPTPDEEHEPEGGSDPTGWEV